MGDIISADISCLWQNAVRNKKTHSMFLNVFNYILFFYSYNKFLFSYSYELLYGSHYIKL